MQFDLDLSKLMLFVSRIKLWEW